MRDRVITIHGVCSSGKWQDDIGAVLEPHFEHVPIRYDDYRSLGRVKLVFEPSILLVAAALIPLYKFLNVGAIGPTLALVLLAHVGSYVRRRRLLNAFKRHIDPSICFGGQPHLIAHSFGTFVALKSLKRDTSVDFGAI